MKELACSSGRQPTDRAALRQINVLRQVHIHALALEAVRVVGRRDDPPLRTSGRLPTRAATPVFYVQQSGRGIRLGRRKCAKLRSPSVSWKGVEKDDRVEEGMGGVEGGKEEAGEQKRGRRREGEGVAGSRGGERVSEAGGSGRAVGLAHLRGRRTRDQCACLRRVWTARSRQASGSRADGGGEWGWKGRMEGATGRELSGRGLWVCDVRGASGGLSRHHSWEKTVNCRKW